MKLMIFLLLLIALFDQSFSYSEYLEKLSIYSKYDFDIKANGSDNFRYILVEIFSLFNTFTYRYKDITYTDVYQLSVKFPKSSNKYTITLSPSSKFQELWFRIIKIKSLEPGERKVTFNNWFINVNVTGSLFNDVQNEFVYSLYGLSIYPKGNVLTWSSEFNDIYQNRKEIIFDTLNQSIHFEYLEKNGVLLYNSTQKPGYFDYTVANRIKRDYLLIIVVNVRNKIRMQYPPVFVRGCIINQQNNFDNCNLLQISYPMYVIMGLALLFLCFSFYFDLIHILFCGWIAVVVITLIIYEALPNFKAYNDIPIYVITLGIAPAIGLICMVSCYCLTSKYNRIRLFFTSLVIAVICVSILWFIIFKFITWNYMTLFYVISAIVAAVIIIISLASNYLTMTMGSVFISTVLISVSYAINNLNLSIIPYIFIDFYNAFIFSTSKWIYFSPLLINDIIILGLCPLLTLLIGIIVYILFRRCKSKKGAKHRRIEPSEEIFDSIHLNPSILIEPSSLRRVNEANAPMFSDPPPVYNFNQTSSNLPLNSVGNMPPSYNSCVNGMASPSAPIQTEH